MLPRKEAERTTEISELFFELPVEDREAVLKITEDLHRIRFGKKAALALAPVALLHDVIITGAVIFWGGVWSFL